MTRGCIKIEINYQKDCYAERCEASCKQLRGCIRDSSQAQDDKMIAKFYFDTASL